MSPRSGWGTNKSDLAMDLRIGSKGGDGGVGPGKCIYIGSIECVKRYRHVVCALHSIAEVHVTIE